MTVGELKEILEKYDNEKQIYIGTNEHNMCFPIENIEESNTCDIDEPTILIIKY